MRSMFNINNIRKKGSVFIKTLISYTLVFIIPLMLIGTANYYITSKVVKDQTIQNYSSKVHEVRNNMDRSLYSLNLFAVQLSALPWVAKLMTLSEESLAYNKPDLTVLFDHINELSTYNAVNEFSDDIAIYFNRIDTVLSTQGKDTFTSFFEDTFRFQDIPNEEWLTKLRNYKTFEFMPLQNVQTFGKPRKLFTYIQSLPAFDRNRKASLMVFIDEQTLVKPLNTSVISEDNSLYVLDSSNNLVTGVNIVPEIQDFVISQNFSEASGTLSKNISFPNSGEFSIFYSISDYNGWKYVIAVSMDNIISSMNYISSFTIIVALLSIAVGLLLSYKLARRSYAPLADLLNDVSSKIFPKEQDFSDEYNFLAKAIEKIFEHGNKAKLELALYEPLAKNACLLKLISGDLIEDHDFENILKTLNIVFDNSYFSCVFILFTMSGSLPPSAQEDIANHLLTQNVSVYFVSITSKSSILILNTSIEGQTQDIIEYIKDYLNNSQKPYKVISVGNTYKGIDNIAKSNAEAAIAADYRFLAGDGCLIHYSDVGGIDNSSCYYYPMEKEEHILNFVKTGEYAPAVSLLKEILDENMKGRKLSPDTLRQMFYDIAATAFKALEDINISVPLTVQLDGLLSLDSAEEMILYVEDIYSQICTAVLAEKESGNTALRKNIIQYIKDNFSDNNLSLTSVAQIFQVSPNYLSRYIKDQTGYNFSDYVNKCRIDASKLLLKGDGTITDIAQKVGFNNDTTFRRLFKKYAGITPGQYKDLGTSLQDNSSDNDI